MRDRYNDDYYDDEEGYGDEYEEEEEEEQEEVREPPKPTKEEKDFLSRRERLKEIYRQKLLKERASTHGRSSLHETLKTPSQDKFGSFFGPSLPGIAPRVIEETKSMRENGYLHSSSKSPGSSTLKGAAQMSSRPKSSNGLQSHRPKIVNEVKKKAEILKGNRDYSFLFSDDGNEPDEPSTKNSSQLKSDPSTSRPASAKHIKEPSRGHPSGPNGSRSVPSTSGTAIQRHSQQQHQRQGSTAQRLPQKQLQRSGTSRQPLPPSNRPRPISNGSHRPSTSTGANGSHRPSTGANGSHRPSTSTSTSTGANGSHRTSTSTGANGSHRPTTAITTNKAPMKAINGSSSHHPVVRKSASVSNPRPHVSSSMQRHPTEQKKTVPMSAKPGVKSAPSRPQLSKQISSAGNGRAREHEKHIASNVNGRVREQESRNATVKKRPVGKRPFDDEDDDNAIDMIRKMFNYNPKRWAGRDEDDSDMEVGFDVIQEEELLSSKIARKEDEEQLRLIEEEERRERERKRKKQKLRHG